METRLDPPLGGLSDDATFTDQPPTTTRQARNVRSIDSSSGRTRLSQRSGLTKHVPDPISGGSPVQHMASIVESGSTVTFRSAATNPEVKLEWSGGLLGGACRDITADRAGLVYALDGPSNVRILNREGTVLGNIEVGLDTGGTTMLARVLVDEVTGNLFVVDVPRAEWTDPATLDIKTGVQVFQSGGATRIRLFARVGAGYNYELVWASSFDPNMHWMDIALQGNALYAVAINSSADTLVGGNYLVKYLIAGGLPIEVARERFVAVGSVEGQQARVAATESGEVFVAVNDDILGLESLTPDPTDTKLFRFDSSLMLASGWPEVGSTSRGFGVALHYDTVSRRVYSVGYNSSQQFVMVAIDIESESYQQDWQTTQTNWFPLDPYLVMDTDQLGNIYVPGGYPGQPAGAFLALRVYTPDDGKGFRTYTPKEHSTESIVQGYFSVATDKIGLPFGGGTSNLLSLESSLSFLTADWFAANSPTITADADAGPFFDGKASRLADTSGTSAFVSTLLSTTTVNFSVYSVYLKADPAFTPLATSIAMVVVAASSATADVGVKLDWSTSPPTLTTFGSLPDENVGISGPLNGYYRVWMRLPGTLSGTSIVSYTAILRIADDSPADTGAVFAYGVKIEQNQTGEPTALNQAYGTELAFLGAEGEVLGGTQPLDSGPYTSVRAVRFVFPESNVDVLRRRTNLAIAGGNVKLFDSDGVLGVAGGQYSVDPDEGLSPDAKLIDSTVAFGKLILVDGARSLIYDVRTGVLGEYKAQSAGSVPDYPQLCATWGGRVVLARFVGNEDDWAMSAIADPLDWDFGTVVNLPTAAVNGSTAPYAGAVPDIITALIPLSDDLLLFGGDQSIHRLTGNPKVDGQIDLISDITGIAFGKAWAKDPEGNLYFVGSKGRLYFAAGGVGVPQPVTERSIDRRLESVDMSLYRYHLEWNYREHGLHVFVIPYGAGGVAVDHWFFERKNGGIWEDRFGSVNVQPASAMVLDGDSVGDRRLLLGCSDGYIRQWDEAATNDDGFPIDSYCLMGPYQLNADREVKIQHVRAVLAQGLGGANLEFYAEDHPDELGVAKWAGRLNPGLNENIRARTRGSYAYVRLQNAVSTERWALESVHLGMVTGGRRRLRA